MREIHSEYIKNSLKIRIDLRKQGSSIPIGAPNIEQEKQRHEALVAFTRGHWQRGGRGGRAQQPRHAGRVEPQRNVGLMRRSGTLRILSADTAAHTAADTAAAAAAGIAISIRDSPLSIYSVGFNIIAVAERALQCAQGRGAEGIRDRVVQCRCAEGRDGGATRRRRRGWNRGRGRGRRRVGCWARRIGISSRGIDGAWRCQDADERAIAGFAKSASEKTNKKGAQ